MNRSAKRFLAIESATKTCSVALFEEQSVIDYIEEGGDYSHAEKLAPFIEKLLAQNQIDIGELSAVSISSGPGSYTGLRIGLSLAKGICVGSQIPLIAIPTLNSMSWGARQVIGDKEALYCPMIDARRMEVYTALYNADGECLQTTSAKIIDEGSFSEELKDKRILFFGDGASKCADLIRSSNAIFLEECYVSARNMAELTNQKYGQKDFEDLAYFEPNYFKDFQAGPSKKLL